MKRQLLFLSLAAALLVGCSKEAAMPDDNAPTTHISAKASGAQSPTTKAPTTGASLNGRQAQVYTTTLPLDAYSGDKTKMFTDAYARGTMTFDDNNYVSYDPAGLSGKMLLPMDKSEVYLYGFYPTGWTSAATGVYESLSHTFDGKTDLMATWVTAADQMTIAYQGGTTGTLPVKADFMFRHLLTCYNIRVVGADASQAALWGRIKSVKFKDATVDKVSTGENFGYTYSAGGGAVSFYKLAGTIIAPTYSDDLFETAAFADMLTPTTTAQPACYAMAAPVTVDADPATAELTLEVVALDKDGGTETTAEIPISLNQAKFAANGNSTRGYTVSITLSFTAQAITPTASVGEWAVGATYEQEVGPPPVPEVGDVIKGGIVFWVSDDKAHYKIMSLVGYSGKTWSANPAYAVGCTDQDNGRANVTKIKAYSAAMTGGATGNFNTDFPMAAFCENHATTETPQGQWYLPAYNELKAIYTNRTVITAAPGFIMGNFYSLWHFSSTEKEFNNSQVHYVFLVDGVEGTYSKTLTDAVRCVASY